MTVDLKEQKISDRRDSQRLESIVRYSRDKNLWIACVITAIIALLSRLAFLFLTTAIYGDAAHYASLGLALANGTYSLLKDTYWVNLFVFWDGFIYLFIKDPTAGAITATLIPGVLTIIPVFWIGQFLFNEKVGFYGALITALHPRLIAFSCNGYSEVFSIFFVTLGVLCLTILLKYRNRSPWLAFFFGICMGVYVSVRSEGIPLYIAMLSTLLFLPRRFILSMSSLLGFGLILGLYISLSLSFFGEPGFGQKKAILMKNFSEQLDLRESVKETYGKEGLIYGHENTINLSNTLNILLKRYPQNLLYTLKKAPGIFLAPLIFTAFLLPFFWRPKNSKILLFAPLLFMLAFPLIFYPAVLVEPRYFFMSIIPINILGFGGLLAFLQAWQPKNALFLLKGTAFFMVLYFIPLTLWYGYNVEKKQKIHRELAVWIKMHVPRSEILTGDGLGYISTTAFLSGNESMPRQWTDNPDQLKSFIQSKGLHWLVVYEPFLREANPEILNILDNGIPGMTKVYEVKDDEGERYQIFQDISTKPQKIQR